MGAEFLEINPNNLDDRKLRRIVDCMKSGGVIIFPTDTIYGIGCQMTQARAVEKICRIKGIDPVKSSLSIICKDISQVSEFVRGLDTPVFKSLKRNLPGPYTLIFRTSNHLPKKLNNRKKTIGIRIPDHPLPLKLVELMGVPMFTSSVKDEDEVIEYTTDPQHIFEKFHNEVDLIIDAGPGKNIPSTVVDITSGEFELVREGLGNFEDLF